MTSRVKRGLPERAASVKWKLEGVAGNPKPDDSLSVIAGFQEKWQCDEPVEESVGRKVRRHFLMPAVLARGLLVVKAQRLEHGRILDGEEHRIVTGRCVSVFM